jgi:flagellar motor protein MotB
MKRIHYILIWFITCLAADINAQEIIRLANPSFEDMARHSKPPRGWYDCGHPNESPPDVQPGWFEVRMDAQEGFTYLGLVTRDNETWEAVGQRLSRPMQGGTCYQFSIHLTHSKDYFSISRTTNKDEFFTKAVKLRVWGGNSYCDKREMLGETGLVTNTSWKKFDIKIEPKRNYNFIMLEAFFKTPTLFPYNGNLLVDNASSLVPIDCETEEPLVKEEEPIASNDRPKPDPKPKPKPDPDPRPDPPVVVPPKPEIMKDLVIDRVREGQTLEIKKLDFDADSAKIKNSMEPVLDEIYTFLKSHPKVKVEIGGHTNSLPNHNYCNWLSRERAAAQTGDRGRKD